MFNANTPQPKFNFQPEEPKHLLHAFVDLKRTSTQDNPGLDSIRVDDYTSITTRGDGLFTLRGISGSSPGVVENRNGDQIFTFKNGVRFTIRTDGAKVLEEQMVNPLDPDRKVYYSRTQFPNGLILYCGGIGADTVRLPDGQQIVLGSLGFSVLNEKGSRIPAKLVRNDSRWTVYRAGKMTYSIASDGEVRIVQHGSTKDMETTWLPDGEKMCKEWITNERKAR